MSTLDRIGRYAVERRLGSGAFALVWLGHDDVLDAPVAIKVLAENWAHQLDLRARFLEEARLLRRADSDRVVRVLDIGDLPDGRPYFVMTYADRGTLAERLAGGARLAVGDALGLAEEVARAVAVLHGLGVIHRDLKPSNVLFQSTVDGERLLVADLGLAKAVAHASGFTVAAGSPGYMAPEQQLVGGGIDVRVDVYGIGAVAYRMLTGVVPQVDGERLTPPSALRGGLPPGTDSVLGRALEHDRERRWPSARLLADVLAELAGLVPAETAAGAAGWGDDEPTVAEPVLRPVPPGPTPPAGAGGQPAAGGATPADQPAGPAAAGAGRADPPTAVELPPRTQSAQREPTAGPAAAGPGARPESPVVREVPVAGRHHPAAPSPLRPAATPRPATKAPPGPSRPTGPGGRRRRGRWLATLALLALAAGAAGGVAVLLARQPAASTVHDRSGRITVTVPAGWGRQLQSDGWSPKAAGLGAEPDAAAVAVSADLSGWRDPSSSTPGVFIGVSGDPALVQKVGRIPHRGCTRTSQGYRGGPFTGTIFRHACPGGASFTEIGLTERGGRAGVYVQIKQPAAEDHTAEILDSLRLGLA